MRLPTLLLADDHALFTEALVRLLDGRFTVLGTFDDGESVVKAAATLHPDLVVMDISMPGVGGLEALARLKSKGISSRVIFLTMHSDARLAAEALQAGASGFVLKHATGEELTVALAAALKGDTYISPALTHEVLALMATPASPSDVALSGRQRRLLELVVEGHRMKEIAVILDLSPRTVETIKYQLMRDLGVHSTAELVKYAIVNGLVAP